MIVFTAPHVVTPDIGGIFTRPTACRRFSLSGAFETDAHNAILPSALPADEVAFGKWQEHAVYSRIVPGAVY